MSTSTTTREAKLQRPAKYPRRRVWLLSGAALLLLLLPVAIYFINLNWPYRYRNVKPLLEDVLASKIKIDHYHRTYFPSPGFEATGLVLRRNAASDVPPIGQAQRLLVQGSWLDMLLLRRRVRLVQVDGLHISIPPKGSKANREDFPAGSSGDFTGPTTAVGEMHILNSLLEIQRTNGGSYEFPIRELTFRDLKQGNACTFVLDMRNAKPAGRIQARGRLGPLLAGKLDQTPASGDFSFSDARLTGISELRGLLSVSGNFRGTFSALVTEAQSKLDGFAVGRGSPTQMTATGRGVVNALNGDVHLDMVEVHVGKSTAQAKGDIAGAPKQVNLDLNVAKGFSQDILRPFVHDGSPITGPVWIRSHAYLAPAEGNKGFLERLKMEGSFEVPAELWTDRESEHKLSEFSKRAEGQEVKENEDPGNVISSIAGSVKVIRGIASTERLSFSMPGAAVDLKGTFNLDTSAVKMSGDLRMKADISHTTSGFKAVLMKAIAPFFKKGKAGAVIPIVVEGSPGKYTVRENLMHGK